MTSILAALLQAAISLLLLVQGNPNIDASFRQQAIAIANQAIQAATQQVTNVRPVSVNPPTVVTPVSVSQGIVVVSPKPNDVVQLPVVVTGYINGNGWTANEGEVGTVQVFDANGKAVSEVGILQVTTDWLKLPTSFKAVVGDREMMAHLQTATGYIKIKSQGARDGESSKSTTIPVRFSSAFSSLPDNCNLISNATFISIDQYETGPTPTGVSMGYWKIDLENGRFNWLHSDTPTSGSYVCKNNVLQATSGSYDTVRLITAYYDGNRQILVWDGIEYRKEASPIGWQTYQNGKYRFSFQYPPGWEATNNLADGVNIWDRSGQMSSDQIAAWVSAADPEGSIRAGDGITGASTYQIQNLGITAKKLTGESAATGKPTVILIFQYAGNYFAIHTPPGLFDQVISTFKITY